MILAISGASGFIGSALARAFKRQNHEVRALVRRPAKDAAEVSWDIERGTIDASRLDGVDAVIHLAGESLATRWTDDVKHRIRESRLQGTSLLARTLASLPTPPRVFLSGSAIGIYGSRGDEWLDENSTLGNDFLASVCKAWEGATEPARAAGIRVVSLRTGLVLSREGGVLAKMLLPFKLGVGGKLGTGNQWMSCIALEDYVRLVSFCLDAESVSGPLNLVGPEPATNEQFTRALARALARPSVFSVPSFALKLAMGEMADETVLASQRVRPARALDAGFVFSCATLDDALRSALRDQRA